MANFQIDTERYLCLSIKDRIGTVEWNFNHLIDALKDVARRPVPDNLCEVKRQMSEIRKTLDVISKEVDALESLTKQP